MRRVLFLAVVVLSGCHGPEPRVAYGNEAGVQIDSLTPRNESQGFQLAEQHCRRYGKIPRIAADQGRRITFDCVLPH